MATSPSIPSVSIDRLATDQRGCAPESQAPPPTKIAPPANALAGHISDTNYSLNSHTVASAEKALAFPGAGEHRHTNLEAHVLTEQARRLVH